MKCIGISWTELFVTLRSRKKRNDIISNIGISWKSWMSYSAERLSSISRYRDRKCIGISWTELLAVRRLKKTLWQWTKYWNFLKAECFVVQQGRRGRFHNQGWQGRRGMTGLMLGHELGQQLLASWVFLEQHRWTTLWWMSRNPTRGNTKQKWLFSVLPGSKNQLLAVWFSNKAAESVTMSPRVLSNHQIVQEGKNSKRAWPHTETAPDQIG